VLARLEELHPDEVRVTFRHFPLLSIHDKASLAGEAAEAAGAQGAFWEMHDYLFEHYAEWVNLAPDAFMAWLSDQAATLELDPVQFQEHLQTRAFEGEMISNFNQGVASGLTGTPFIFINGSWFRLEPTIENMEAAVRLLLLEDRQFDNPPPMEISPGERLRARIRTTEGEILVELLPDSAPVTVNNFIFLAENGWFDGNAFFRVVEGTLIETGDPTGTGFGSPGYLLRDEIDPDLSFDKPGMVAMSSAGPDTNGSQFFFTLSPVPELNGVRTIFGRVLTGFDVLNRFTARQPFDDLFSQDEPTIQSIIIERP
jgi:cyclophilin family peptidyl-prolyl cis-trans isomerase